MDFWHAMLTVMVVHQLAVMSPGPDFAITMRNSLAYGRLSGVWTAVGVGLGIMVHVGYSLLGVGLLIAQSVVLFSVIKLVGAAYLLYVGVQCLWAKPAGQEAEAALPPAVRKLMWRQAVMQGFLCNALNPKATLFFLSLFTVILNPAMPSAWMVAFGAYMVVATMAWFTFVAMMFSHARLRNGLMRIRHWIERGMGVVLVALGLKLAMVDAGR